MPSKKGPPDLRYVWSKREKDYMIHFPRSCDGHLLYQFFSKEGSPVPVSDRPEDRYKFRPMDAKEFFAELERRGYDLTTLRFSVRRKPTPGQTEGGR